MRWIEIRNPHVDGCWGSKEGGMQFVIAHIRGLGFTATYKNLDDLKSPAIFLGDGTEEPFKTWQEAEDSCQLVLNERKKSLQ